MSASSQARDGGPSGVRQVLLSPLASVRSAAHSGLKADIASGTINAKT